MWNEILQKIKSLLEEITDVVTVYDYEAEKFIESPVCVITPSSNESDYNTSSENERVYAFKIMVFINNGVPLTVGGNASSDGDRIMRETLDLILNKLDVNWDLQGLTVPTGYQFINMFAAPSIWGYMDREISYRVAEVNVKCRVVVDLNEIS